MGRHIRDDEFRKLFESGQPVRISEIMRRLGTSRATVTRLFGELGTLLQNLLLEFALTNPYVVYNPFNGKTFLPGDFF